jgi:hypothetical protein
MNITCQLAIRAEPQVIDLSVPHPEGGYDPESGLIVLTVWHSDDPAFPADGVMARERLAVPPGSEIDLRCPDCTCSVTVFTGELAAVAARRLGADLVAGVAHSPSCPWLARQIRSGAA